MYREFVRLPEFEKQCKHIGLTEDDIQEIENSLLLNPNFGDVMEGTGGLRKFRIALPGRSKSSGARVIYIDFMHCEKIYLVTTYPKNEIDNLTKAERNELKVLIKILESELRRRGK